MQAQAVRAAEGDMVRHAATTQYQYASNRNYSLVPLSQRIKECYERLNVQEDEILLANSRLPKLRWHLAMTLVSLGHYFPVTIKELKNMPGRIMLRFLKRTAARIALIEAKKMAEERYREISQDNHIDMESEEMNEKNREEQAKIS